MTMPRSALINWSKHAIHGRNKEAEEIKIILNQISDGAPSRIVGITGPSGIGKSALVTEGVYPEASKKGLIASGKFDQFLPQTPYAAVLKCLRSLFHSFFFNPHTPPSQKASQVQTLIDIVGPNKEILCGAIPELSSLLPSPTSKYVSPFNLTKPHILNNSNINNNNTNNNNVMIPLSPGPSPNSPNLFNDSVSISESRNRFHTIFLGVLGMITSNNMVTIFVDDVQWADVASLELLASLIEGQRKNLLILVTSRESFLPFPLATLPLTTLLSLHPFSLLQVLDYIKSILSLPESNSVLSLSSAIHSQTAGNPFFVSQLLRQAMSDGIVTYDSRTSEWVVNSDRISRMSMVSDVVEFLLEKLKKLPTSVSEVLRVAACLGSTFGEDVLEEVMKKSNGCSMKGLNLAEAEGLVTKASEVVVGPTVYKFSHDRVMQASHSNNTDLQIQQIHLAAGEVLMQQGKDLYEIADHFAKSLPLIPADRLQNLCVLFLKVAKNAKIAAAFDSASRYAQVGIGILKKIHSDWLSSWKTNYTLTYSLMMINMECAYNHGDQALSAECYKDIQEHALLEDAILTISARMILLVNESQFSDAIELGCEAITRLGIPGVSLPRHPTQAELGSVFAEIDSMLQGNIYTIFESLPRLSHQLVSLAVTILASTGTASYFYDVSVFAYSSSLVVKLTLQYGLTPQATPGLTIYALLCSSITGDFKRAYEIGEVATILSNTHALPVYQCQVHFIFYSILQFYRKHIRENIPHLRRGLILCAQVGNTLYGAFTAVHIPITRLWQSDPLEEVTAEYILSSDTLGTQCRFADALPMTSAGLYCCRSLMGTSCQQDLEPSKVQISPFGTAWSASLRVKAHNLLHRYDQVLADAEAHCKNVVEDIKGQMTISMFYFHYSLSLASLFHRDNPTPSDHPNSMHYVEKLKANLEVLRKWAACSQLNCEHRYVLIEAEFAHISNQNEEALRLYESASQLAIQREFYHHNAIILEHLSMFLLRTGHRDRARETLKRSIDGYARWGACAVVSVLVSEHAGLLGVKTFVPLDPLTYPLPTTDTDIDVSEVVECSSVVSESTNLGKLITSFLSRVVTYFHVAYGCLLLTQGNDETCYTHVQWSRSQNRGTPCATLLRSPIPVPETFSDTNSLTCCSRAVRAALLMKRAVVVNYLPDSGLFSEPYFSSAANAHARSLVCMPLLLHGKVLGTVYLESDNPHAFTLGSLQTLQLLCAQAAITIENSQLVEKEVIARAEAEAAIAEKDLALKEMQASQQRYQTLAQAIPQLIWISNADGNVEWANDQFITYLGSSKLGDVWSEHIHPDDLTRFRSAWLAASLPGATFCEEVRMRDGQGNYQWFLSRALAAHDAKGNLIRWFGTNTNVDAQKKNLEERTRLSKVEMSERYYRALAEALPQLVWTSLPDGRVNYYNGRWKEFSGVTLLEGEVMGWWPIVHPQDLEACQKQFKRATRKCKGFSVECRLRRHDGQFRWHLVRAVRLKDPIEGTSAPLVPSPSMQSVHDDPEEANETPESGFYYFGTCTDIDDQKKAEVSLIEARKAAEHMAEMKSQWVANMSHELRTPSNGILGMLDLLMDTPLTPEQKDYVGTMRRSTNVLLTVISDILDFRRNETKQVKLQPEPFSARGVMEDVCEILFPLAAAKDVELVHLCATDVPRVLIGDPARLRQVLVNLIGNSIKFSKENGGQVEVKCRLTSPDQCHVTQPLSTSTSTNSNSTNSSAPSPLASPLSSRESTPSNSPRLPNFSNLRHSGESSVPSLPPLAIPSARIPTSPCMVETLLSNGTPATISPRSSTESPSSVSSMASAPTTPTLSSQLTIPSIINPSNETIWLQFDVSDTGVGIPKTQQAMLFQPFFQVDSSGTRKHGGTGLGLAISRQIVAALGGKIWVQSEEGCGSTFSFTAQFPIPQSLSLALPPASPRLLSQSNSHNSRFFTPHPLSASITDPPPIQPPQHVIVFSDRNGATKRVLLEYLNQIFPPSSPLVLCSCQVSIVESASDLVPVISTILSHPSPPSSPSISHPYIACVVEVSNVASANSMLSCLSPFLSSNDYIFKVAMITSPHLRAQITLPIIPSPPLTISPPTSPSSSPSSIVFLMKPLSESKLRTALSLSQVSTPTNSQTISSSPQLLPPIREVCESSPFLSPAIINPPLKGSNSILPLNLATSSPNISSPRSACGSRKSSTSSLYDYPLMNSSSSLSSLPELNDSSSSIPLSILPLSLSNGGPNAKIRRALCAEDIFITVNQKIIVWHLRKLGFTVDIANDGSAAVEKVTSHPPGYYCFLLMDLQMPEMDGFVATKLIRESEATQREENGESKSEEKPEVTPLPIIAITANVMPGVHELCSEAGMDGYVSKPVQIVQLTQVLRELAIIV